VKLLSVEQIAETLGVSRQTVMRLICEGSLPAVCLRSGRRKKVWRVRPEALERWLNQKERETMNQQVCDGRQLRRPGGGSNGAPAGPVQSFPRGMT
jgi:excisionase family DNA binding protein